jgi:HSP20 family protein
MLWRNFDNRGQSVWNELDRLRREMDRLVRSGPRVAAPAFPALNVWSNAEGLLVTSEIPGIEPEDIDISIVGETLTLSGTRRPEEVGQDVLYHRHERGHGQFTRSLQLPYRVEADKIEALFDKGVLHIRLPRAEADKPRKISIKTAQS